jgi:hypothetical protein
MGMSGQLFLDMMEIPSNKLRMLNYVEMQAFSLVGEDPGYGEWIRARSHSKDVEQARKESDAWHDRQNAFIEQYYPTAQPLDCMKGFTEPDPHPLK